MNKIMPVLIACVLSFFLFALMNLLIDKEAKAYTPEKNMVIEWQFSEEDLTPKTIEHKKIKPPEFKEPEPIPRISDAQMPDKPVAPKPPIQPPNIRLGSGIQGEFGRELFHRGINDGGNGLKGSRSPKVRIEPHYPPIAARNNIEGFVTLEFDIDEKGETTNIRIIKAKPKGYFEKVSRRAVKKWKYKNPTSDESVAAVNQRVTLNFGLEKES